jgi:hypothetical protein
VFTRRLRIRQLLAQTAWGQAGHNKRTFSAKILGNALHIESNANIEEATTELLRIQDKNEKHDNSTSNERRTTGSTTESMSVS